VPFPPDLIGVFGENLDYESGCNIPPYWLKVQKGIQAAVSQATTNSKNLGLFQVYWRNGELKPLSGDTRKSSDFWLLVWKFMQVSRSKKRIKHSYNYELGPIHPETLWAENNPMSVQICAFHGEKWWENWILLKQDSVLMEGRSGEWPFVWMGL